MHVLCIVCALVRVALTTFIKQQDNNMLSLLAWNIFSTQLDCSEPIDVICGCISTALQVDVTALTSAAETCQDCPEQSPISSTTSAATNIQDINSSMPAFETFINNEGADCSCSQIGCEHSLYVIRCLFYYVKSRL